MIDAETDDSICEFERAKHVACQGNRINRHEYSQMLKS
jgi:hypothetical protein